MEIDIPKNIVEALLNDIRTLCEKTLEHNGAKMMMRIIPDGTIMRFPGGNSVNYGQDHHFYSGIDHSIQWTVRWENGILHLTAPGYGGEPYVNGSIIPY